MLFWSIMYTDIYVRIYIFQKKQKMHKSKIFFWCKTNTSKKNAGQ